MADLKKTKGEIAHKMTKLPVKHEDGEQKLNKMTHSTKNRVLFTGKGGFAKNFKRIEATSKKMDAHDQP